MQISETPIWQSLVSHQKVMQTKHLKALFANDPERFERFSVRLDDFLMDYSKQQVTEETIQQLLELANVCELNKHIQALYAGNIINKTEQRPAEHMSLRALQPKPQIQAVLAQMESFVDVVRNGQYLGATKEPITDVISLGIGGSDLGPVMACEALEAYRDTTIRVHFLSNVDGFSVQKVLQSLSPTTTLCIINSKSFTTPETLQNANTIQQWFLTSLKDRTKVLQQHFIGVTVNTDKAEAFGLPKKHIFKFWDSIGGRYSIWSAVGLPIALQIGMSNFKAFLQGAYEMDQHFLDAPFEENMPVLLGLLGIWNHNFWGYTTQAVMPYADRLKNFPAYLQQLEMESNGKQAASQGGYVNHMTAPVIWGGVGCNGQHAYMQLLHQGKYVIPVDFIVPVKGCDEFEAQQDLLVASCLSQSQALMLGRLEDELSDELQHMKEARMCPGNRPSTTLMLAELSPKNLGRLIALYEHKVFVQGVIWQIQSFDQWGVELGKQIANQILSIVEGCSPQTMAMDASTQGLLNYYLRYKRK